MDYKEIDERITGTPEFHIGYNIGYKEGYENAMKNFKEVMEMTMNCKPVVLSNVARCEGE